MSRAAVGIDRGVRVLGLTLCAFLFSPFSLAEAQPEAKAPRVGILAALSSDAIADRIHAFRRALHELGHIEGKTIHIEYRYADGKLERLPDIAAELVRLKVDVIVTGGPAATRPAKAATSAIPIVMAQDSDPVSAGFVASLARPGGNITGLANLSADLSGKQLELLKEIVPRLARVAVFGTSTEPGHAQTLKDAQAVAKLLGIRLQVIDIKRSEEIEPAFQTARKERNDALLVLASAVATFQRRQLAAFAIKAKLPAIYQISEAAQDGGMMVYGANIADLWRRAATYVDKIIKGAKPADLPVEQPTRFDLVINLKTAKQIGLTIPPNVLARADRVIR